LIAFIDKIIYTPSAFATVDPIGVQYISRESRVFDSVDNELSGLKVKAMLLLDGPSSFLKMKLRLWTSAIVQERTALT
jgi:hypothetical protein